jgi:hypothetical protein
MYRRARKLN